MLKCQNHKETVLLDMMHFYVDRSSDEMTALLR